MTLFNISNHFEVWHEKRLMETALIEKKKKNSIFCKMFLCPFEVVFVFSEKELSLIGDKNTFSEKIQAILTSLVDGRSDWFCFFFFFNVC